MAKTLEQKVEEFMLRGEQEKAKRIYKKTFQLEKKYEKMIGLRAEKLRDRLDIETTKATKKIIRQVDTVVKRKIRDAKGWKPTNTRIEKKTLPKLKNILLTLIQKYCRLRDTNEKGYGKCISCPEIRHYTGADGGHFYSRRINSTAFDEMNINLQCKGCNGFKGGNREGYIKGFIEKYGKKALNDLELRSKQLVSLDREWMEAQIPIYKEKIKDLESKKL